MMDERYLETVRLMLGILPDVFEEPDFAMKGGTALNLFVGDLPRLSVDIDVVFTDHRKSRGEALEAIRSSLGAVKARLAARGIDAELPGGGGEESKLFARRGNALVKVEVNHVFRGTVLDVEHRVLSETAQDVFAMEVSAPTLGTEELYGSKLVAAMDRQHPRDLFDVLGMFRGGGLTRGIVDCFVCYLAGHNRPVHEVLFARRKDISEAFRNEFQGMCREPVEIGALLDAREKLWSALPAALAVEHREFLVGLVRGEPDWELLPCRHLPEMPAIRWKLANLARLKAQNPEKFSEQARLLREAFEM
jgi:hypothetical protein